MGHHRGQHPVCGKCADHRRREADRRDLELADKRLAEATTDPRVFRSEVDLLHSAIALDAPGRRRRHA